MKILCVAYENQMRGLHPCEFCDIDRPVMEHLYCPPGDFCQAPEDFCQAAARAAGLETTGEPTAVE